MKIRDCWVCEGSRYLPDGEPCGNCGGSGQLKDVGGNEDYRPVERVRHYVPLEGGGQIQFSGDRDIDGETVDALKQLGEAARDLMKDAPARAVSNPTETEEQE